MGRGRARMKIVVPSYYGRSEKSHGWHSKDFWVSIGSGVAGATGGALWAHTHRPGVNIPRVTSWKENIAGKEIDFNIPAGLNHICKEEINQTRELFRELITRIRKEYEKSGEEPGDFEPFLDNKEFSIIGLAPKKPGLKKKVEKIQAEYSERAKIVAKALESKYKKYRSEHGLGTDTQVIAHLKANPPLDKNAFASHTATGAGLGLGATLLGILGYRGVKKGISTVKDWLSSKKRLRGKMPVAFRHEAKNASHVPQAPKPAQQQKSGGIEPSLPRLAEKHEKTRWPERSEKKLLQNRLERMGKQAGLGDEEMVKLKSVASQRGVGYKDYFKIRAIIAQIKHSHGKPETPEVKQQASQRVNAKHLKTRVTPIKPNEMLRAFRAMGFMEFENRGKGGHMFLRHHDGRTATIPFYSTDISVDLVERILREARISRESYLEALRKS